MGSILHRMSMQMMIDAIMRQGVRCGALAHKA